MDSWAVKYRPKTFEEVKGQPERAHLRALMRDRESFPSLLIFRGPSGTGKTTLARIVAAALNCSNLGPKFDPCGECESCRAIQAGNFVGVYEHNAALHNGADDMRELQERSYQYGQGEYNVFILDEAQALSSQAWKVLLKLFEEPPANSVFILVTSEPNKIPQTIRTRAISYDIGKVPADVTFELLESISEKEGVTVSGLDMIVDLAGGSVREAIMLLEQCARTNSSAEESFKGRDVSIDLLEALVGNDTAAALTALDTAWNTYGDASYVLLKIGEALELVLHSLYQLPSVYSKDLRKRADRIADHLGEEKIGKLLEVVAAWEVRTNTKTHLLFVWGEMRKVVHGGTMLQTAKNAIYNKNNTVKKAPASPAEISAALADL